MRLEINLDSEDNIIKRWSICKEDPLDTIYYMLPNPKYWPKKVHQEMIEKIRTTKWLTKFEIKEIRERFLSDEIDPLIREEYLTVLDYRKKQKN